MRTITVLSIAMACSFLSFAQGGGKAPSGITATRVDVKEAYFVRYPSFTQNFGEKYFQMKNGVPVTNSEGVIQLKAGVSSEAMLEGSDVTRIIVRAKDESEKISVYFREVISKTYTTVTGGAGAGTYVSENYNDRLAVDPAPGKIYVMSGTKDDTYVFRFAQQNVQNPINTGISFRIKNDGGTQTWELTPGDVGMSTLLFWGAALFGTAALGAGTYAIMHQTVFEPVKPISAETNWNTVIWDSYRTDFAKWQNEGKTLIPALAIGAGVCVAAAITSGVFSVRVSPNAFLVSTKF
ncbi:MAG: hypothetical protein HZC28_00360 [Spirochaetes bacterium]|nr:hypothetical protein [Spirochaetota bacterium]